MSVKERLKDYINYKGLTVQQFEKSVDMSNGYVNSISKGIGTKKLERILEIYSNLNLNWLFTGQGDMEINTYSIGTKNHILEDRGEGYEKDLEIEQLKRDLERKNSHIDFLEEALKDCKKKYASMESSVRRKS